MLYRRSLSTALAVESLLVLVLDVRPMLALSELPLTLPLLLAAALLLAWLLGVLARAWLAAVEARAALGSLCVIGGRPEEEADGEGEGGGMLALHC